MHTPCTHHMHTPCTHHAHPIHTPCIHCAHTVHTPCIYHHPAVLCDGGLHDAEALCALVEHVGRVVVHAADAHEED
eukprot:scaffold119230_cov42-Phaeocystis_antarctica.AAC.1